MRSLGKQGEPQLSTRERKSGLGVGPAFFDGVNVHVEVWSLSLFLALNVG